ncbi:major facilitator superfamily domain-containing protein [Rhexocercosporidium sp. MPI-PUGE-AT-0058]|nr:major facilitator superfamily domain-containing protein [Rhexocercosporidium sp. MPI-PUGE-AT-0058]
MANTKLMGSNRPWLWEVRSSTWFIVLVVSSGVFTDLFLYGVIIPVIPHAIVSRAGVPAKDRQEWVTILLLTEATTYLVTSPIFGHLSDHSSLNTRHLPYLSGLLLLAVSLALQTASRSTTVYLIGRALQGASSSAIWVVGLAIIVDTVDSRHIGRYMGYVGLAMSVGNLLGPLLGGLVLEYGGYYAVFGMGFAVLGVDGLLRMCLAASFDSDPQKESVDKSSVLARSNSIKAKDQKEKHHTILSRCKSPRLLFTLWACMIPTLILAAFESTLPTIVLQTFSWSSLGGGLIFIPLTLPSFFSPLAGKFSDTHGARLCSTFGFLGMVPPLVCLRFVERNALSQKVLLCALLAIVGTMIACVFAPVMAEVERVVGGIDGEAVDDRGSSERAMKTGGGSEGRNEKSGGRATAYALVNMAYAFGILCGPLVGGFVKKDGGLPLLGWVLGLLCGFSGVCSFLMIGGWIGEKRGGKGMDEQKGR